MATLARIYPHSGIYPGKFNVVPTSETVIVADGSWNANSTNWGGFGLRQLIPAASVLENASAVSVEFVAPSTGEGFAVANAYIGEQAASGDAWDFAATPTQILFSAGATFSISAGETIVSDSVTISIDSAENLIVAVGMSSDTANDSVRTQGSASGFNIYYKSGAASESGTADVTGYSASESNRLFVGEILKIS